MILRQHQSTMQMIDEMRSLDIIMTNNRIANMMKMFTGGGNEFIFF